MALQTITTSPTQQAINQIVGDLDTYYRAITVRSWKELRKMFRGQFPGACWSEVYSALIDEEAG